MILRSKSIDPKKLMLIGSSFLVVAIASRVIHPTFGFGDDALDFVNGMFIGISIGVNLWAALLFGRQRRGAR
ncbi:MAG: hypothetical protein ACJ8AJ_04330 [Gemmatimonadaceae bacterium]|jgi:hypothetical protein